MGQQLLSSLIEFAKLNRHEPDVVARLKQIHGDVFWDIGANIGFYSFLLRKNFKRIIAVEPNPRTAYMLKKRINFFLVHNVEVKELALSNRREWASFYSGREWYAGPGLGNLLSGISNLYSSDSLQPRAEHRFTFRVRTERFDDVSSGPVDLVKIDVEPELLVLEGMEKSLGSGLVRNLLIEMHDRDNKVKLESLLSAHGYDLFWTGPRHALARHSLNPSFGGSGKS